VVVKSVPCYCVCGSQLLQNLVEKLSKMATIQIQLAVHCKVGPLREPKYK